MRKDVKELHVSIINFLVFEYIKRLLLGVVLAIAGVILTVYFVVPGLALLVLGGGLAVVNCRIVYRLSAASVWATLLSTELRAPVEFSFSLQKALGAKSRK